MRAHFRLFEEVIIIGTSLRPETHGRVIEIRGDYYRIAIADHSSRMIHASELRVRRPSGCTPIGGT